MDSRRTEALRVKDQELHTEVTKGQKEVTKVFKEF